MKKHIAEQFELNFLSPEETIKRKFSENRLKSEEDKRIGYEKYLKRYDSLKDACARYPYSIVIINPPDNNMMYFRKMTFEEFCSNDMMLLEFLE